MRAAENRFVLALQIKNDKEVASLIGDGRMDDVRRDIQRGFRKIANSLLGKYDVLRDEVAVARDFRFVPFAFKPSVLPRDQFEQIQSLRDAGTELVRTMLAHIFGKSIGDRVTFKLLVEPFGDDVDKTEALTGYVLNLIESSASTGLPKAKIERGEFERIIEERAIETFLQPVVSLPGGEVVGFEALARGPLGSPVRSAGDLFNAASAYSLTSELEMVCARNAIEAVRHLPCRYWFSVNIGPRILQDGAFWDLVFSEPVCGYHTRLVLELTEHLPLGETDELADAMREIEQAGIRWSLDDTGCGFSDIDSVAVLKPAMVKMCITVVSQIGLNPEVTSAISAGLNHIRGLGAELLGEGVETKLQADGLADLGVTLAQGYFFGKPRPAAEVIKELPE
jgi:EAL domain-containing protein (putative c-di-GMP-specific phosphodiesterase class I)